MGEAAFLLTTVFEVVACQFSPELTLKSRNYSVHLAASGSKDIGLRAFLGLTVGISLHKSGSK